EEEPDEPEILGLVGCAAARLGDTLQAEASMDRLSGSSRPEGPRELYYQMATIAAVLGRPDEAMRLLYQAYSEGLPHGLQLHQDMNFESLREREDFIALVTPKG
ncbi:MAG: TPR end-of-group domain-containing protein, partial [Longimicrobiales bacterium]